MQDILKKIDKVRKKIQKDPANSFLIHKSFAKGMYHFSMFMISYFARVREQLKLDYDSFMIVQTVVTHTLYHLNKKTAVGVSYEDLEAEWKKIIKKTESVADVFEIYKPTKSYYKLITASVCLVTKLPKETVRRKVNELTKKNILKNSKDEGIRLGPKYKKIFQEFVPQTTAEVSKLVKVWEKEGILKSVLGFKI